MTWDDLLELYLRELRARRLVSSSYENESRKLRRFRQICALQGPDFPEDFQSSHLRALHRTLEGLTPLSRYGFLGTVRRLFKWAHYRNHLLHNPVADWQPRHPSLTNRWVPTETEMVEVLAAPSQETIIGRRDSFLLEFLYGTGLRVKECDSVDLHDVDIQQRVVNVRKGKGGKSRVLPLGDGLLEKTRFYLQEIRPALKPRSAEMALFIHSRGGRMACFSINAAVRRYGLQYGHPNFSVHSIRHAYATHLLLGGAPLVLVQRLLGHESIDSTSIYTRMLPLDLQTELLRTHPRGKRRPKRR